MPRATTCEIDAFGEFHFLGVHAQNFFAAFHVGQIDRDLAIETAGTQQRGIENIGPVRRGDDDDAFLRIEAVHLDEQRIERLLALIVTAADAVAAMATDRVDFVDENNAGRGFLSLLEHVAHAGGADADEHLDEIGAADREERHVRFAGDGACEQRLAGSRRADEQNAFRNAAAEFLKFFRIAQKLDQFLHFVLRFLHAGDVAKCDFVFVAREHARLALAEIQRAFAGHADLLPEEEIKNDEEDGDREKADQCLRQHIRFGANRRLNPGGGQSLLQIRVVIQVNRRAKRHLLSRRAAGALFQIIRRAGFGSAGLPRPPVAADNSCR